MGTGKQHLNIKNIVLYVIVTLLSLAVLTFSIIYGLRKNTYSTDAITLMTQDEYDALTDKTGYGLIGVVDDTGVVTLHDCTKETE